MLQYQPMQRCSAVWSSCWSAFGWSDVSSQHFLSLNRTYCQGLLLALSLTLILIPYLGFTQTLSPLLTLSLLLTHLLNLTHFIHPSVSIYPYLCFVVFLISVTGLIDDDHVLVNV